jgi:Fe-Mn family superoxide dismutase
LHRTDGNFARKCPVPAHFFANQPGGHGNGRCSGQRQCLINLDKEPARDVPVSIETGLFRNFRLSIEEEPMSFKLPDLPYAHDALAPHMSRETLEYHHDKHHKAYVDNGNKLLEGSGLEGKSLEEIVKGSFGKNAGLFNNAAQHYNHLHFWKWMKPNGGGDKVPAKLKAAIDKDLGGLEKLKTDFSQAGATQFGSGWCWIVVQGGKLTITKTPNGENPLVHGGTPILGCDVWEHSYYIDYRNRRPDYLKAFLEHLVNWEYVEELFLGASK